MGQLCGCERGKSFQKLIVKPTNNNNSNGKRDIGNGDVVCPISNNTTVLKKDQEKNCEQKNLHPIKEESIDTTIRNSVAVTPQPQLVSDHYDNDVATGTTDEVIRICLMGNRESGKSTILEQIRKMSKVSPTALEFELRKSFIFNNCVNSMRKILEYMNNTQTPLRRLENKDYAELILENERTHGNPLSELECRALSSLWKDETIQELYVRRAEYCLNDSTKYFMENLTRIKSPNYRPIHDDLLMAYIPTVGVQNMIFTINDSMFQFLEIGGSKILDRKWSNLFQGLDAIFFTLAISVYDHMLANGQFEFNYSMGILEQLCKEECFENVPLYIFLNECDVFKEKLHRVRLVDYFEDYKGHSTKEAFRFIREYIIKRCATHRKNMKNVEFHFSCAIDTKQMHTLLSNVLTEIIQRKKRG